MYIYIYNKINNIIYLNIYYIFYYILLNILLIYYNIAYSLVIKSTDDVGVHWHSIISNRISVYENDKGRFI